MYCPVFLLVNSHTISGFLGPFHFSRHPRSTSFLWASLAHSILTFPWACYILLETPLGPFAFFRASLLLYGHVDHYFSHSGLMVFSYFARSSSFTLFILLGFFLLLGPFAIMSINNYEEGDHSSPNNFHCHTTFQARL